MTALERYTERVGREYKRHGVIEWGGFDTETAKGRAVLCSVAFEGRAHSLVLPRSFEQIVEWLFTVAGAGGYFTPFNLDYDAAAVLKFLGPGHLRRLAFLGYTRTAKHGIWLIKGKELIIRRLADKARIRFYDAYPFYQLSLAAAAPIVGMAKVDVADEWLKNMGAMVRDPAMRPLAIERCESDAEIARRLMVHANRSFDAGGLSFSRPLSPGYLAGQLLRKRIMRCDNGAFAFSYYGGRVEVWKRGHLGPTLGYDIRSAYPAVLSRALNPRAKAVRTDEFRTDAIYGTYLCYVETLLPLVPFRLPAGELIYPVGTWCEWYTRPHVELLRKHGARCEILAGWEYLRTGEEELLLPEIPDMYRRRKACFHCDAPESAHVSGWRCTQFSNALDLAYKLVLNSLYGKLASRTPKWFPVTGRIKPGDELIDGCFYRQTEQWGGVANVAIAAYTTASVQAQITEAAMAAGDSRVILMATDGLLLTGHADIGLPLTPALGDWESQEWDDSVVVGAGVYATHGDVRNKKTGEVTKKWKNRYRGFQSRERLVDLLTSGTGGACTHGKPKAECDHCREWIEIPALRGQSLMQAARLRDFKDFSVLTDIRQRKNINADEKRTWQSRFQHTGAVMSTRHDSLPLLVIESPRQSRKRLMVQGRLPRCLRREGFPV